ncbi:MAG: hypothetical protein EA340_01650 [Nitriliruptor sp.]|nr:MAG: hypothetical protein EA340_01650 [Nitriliruptor sp.]
MVDVTSVAGTGSSPGAAGEDRAREGRTIRPPRSLPGGRAVVGALLIAAAAVVTFAAYLDATSAPTRSYVVATAPVEPGTRLGDMAEVSERFGTIALDLSDEVAARVLPASAVDSLVGQVVVTPLQPGDLLTRTQLVDDGGAEGAQTLSFSLPRTAAVAGALRPGERVDVLATFGSGDGAYTAYVVRGVPLLGISAPDGGPLGGSSELTLTVAVSALRDVQALGHAVNTAEVFVTRSTASPEVDDPAPGAFRSTPQDVGPLPDPATPATPDRTTGDGTGELPPHGGDPEADVDGGSLPDADADADTDADADPETDERGADAGGGVDHAAGPDTEVAGDLAGGA